MPPSNHISIPSDVVNHFYKRLAGTDITSEQRLVIEKASPSSAVISCPGSGKTFTAALRTAYRLSKWDSRSSGIALLSHTNVAVRSFALELEKSFFLQFIKSPHFCGTIDSFIARYCISNFGQSVLKCARKPRLIGGSEEFLQNSRFKVLFLRKDGKSYPKKITDLCIGLQENRKPFIYLPTFDSWQLPTDPKEAWRALRYLAAQGYYTYDHARYWAAVLFRQNPHLLKIFAHRFREIIVDEAQDTNIWQQIILERLEENGSRIMLIGDPDQSIFEFGQADSTFLKTHAQKTNVEVHKLSVNQRSNERIVKAAQSLSSMISVSLVRKCLHSWEGAFVVGYKKGAETALAETFLQKLERWGLQAEKCAILARSNDLVDKLRGDVLPGAHGATHRLAQAAVARDSIGDVRKAFEITKSVIVNLCGASKEWISIDTDPEQYELRLYLRKKLWTFVRNSSTGLPSSHLNAKSEWHPRLKQALQNLFVDLEGLPYLNCPNNLGNKVSATKLLNAPLMAIGQKDRKLRVDTVHSVKGETFDAVLYVASKTHIYPLLRKLRGETSENELTRIGYVAITRPRHALWLGIPDTLLSENSSLLQQCGFEI